VYTTKPVVKLSTENMETFSGRSAVLLALFFFVNAVSCDEINFYDENGSFSMIRTIGYGGCYKFAPVWDKRATAVDIVENRSCFNVWRNTDCTGDHLKLEKKEGSYELRNMNFDKAISSVSLCSWDDQGRPDPMRGLQHYNNRPVFQPQAPEGGSFGGRMRGEVQGGIPDNRREIIRGVAAGGTYIRRDDNARFPPQNSAINIQQPSSDVWELAVQEINRFRTQHGAKELRGDPSIHQDAQQYAESQASSNRLQATTFGNRYASTIATSFRKSKSDAVKDAISRWYNKSKLNDYEMEATEVGIGAAWNEQERLWVIVAFYNLPDIYYFQKFHEQTGGNIPSGRPLRTFS